MDKKLDNLLNLMGKIVEITSKNQETLEVLTKVMSAMVKPKEHKVVWLVKQTQYHIDDLNSDDYLRQTIYVCSTKEKAEQYAKELNKEYGAGAVFDDNNLFVDLDYDSDYHHYYDVECMEVDEPLA